MIVRSQTLTNASHPQPQSSLSATIQRNWITRRLAPVAECDSLVPVVIGVSGGADSVCLLHALHKLSADLGLIIHIAHLNHNLRPESREDAQFVASLCRQYELPFHESTLPAGSLAHSPGGLEDGARRARYTFLCRVAYQVVKNVTGEDRVPLIAVAHTLEDQAETLLLNLTRGSGLRGLGGMRWRTQLVSPDPSSVNPIGESRPVWLIRPLLNVHRSDIEAYLTQNDLAWREDSSNSELHFSRNLLRHRILPQLAAINPNIVDTIARTAQIVSDDVDRLERLDRELMNELRLADTVEDTAARNAATGNDDPVRITLDYTRFSDLDQPQQRGVLRAAIDQLPGGLYGVDAASIDRLLGQLQSGTASDSPLPTSGPHPLIGTLAWSFVSSSAWREYHDRNPASLPLVETVEGSPTGFTRSHSTYGHKLARLILHHDTVLPVPPWGPQLAAGWTPVELPDSGELQVDGWRLRVDRISTDELPAEWSNVSPWQSWLDSDKIGRPMLSRPTKGMRIAPLGMAGKTRALGDLFTDEKIHPSLREGWPLLIDKGQDGTDGDRILWVCGLRLGHNARITDNTVHVLALTWEPI